MTWKPNSLVVFLLATVLTLPAAAQKDLDPDGKWRGKLYCLATWAQNANPEEPKDVAEAFLNTTELLPRPLSGLGSVSFPVDTKNAEAQQWFNHGLASLHLLWDEEAERAFRQVLTLDPESAMGFWGLAMANFDRPGRGAFFARMAKGKVKPNTPAAARAWVDSISRFFAEPASPLAPRLQAFANDLEGFVLADTKDLEAKALLLRQLVLNDYRGGLEVRSPLAVDRLAGEVLAANPAHPSQHTRRFLWMKHRPANLAPAGLLAPDAISADAPAPPWRYLGEAQQAAGQWEAGAASFAAAVQAGLTGRAHWFERPVRGPAFEDDCVALIESLSRLGRAGEALQLAEAMMEESLPGSAASDVAGELFWSSAHGRGVRAFVQVCHEHRLHDRLPPLAGRVQAVAAHSPAADAIVAQLAKWIDPKVTTVASHEARAQNQLNVGDAPAAIKTLAELPEYRRAAFLPRALWIIAHLKAGMKKEALFGFDQEFRRQAGGSDSPLREHPALREVAALRRIGSAWQLPASPLGLKLAASVRKVTGELRTAQPKAPGFSLPNRHAKQVTLESLRGKPVVLIFFLGAGCFQCVEQLHAFLPEVEAYTKAGIPIVAISTDPISVLEYSITEEKRGNKPIPFTILSDGKLAVFREYLVYNEFERRPLHGTVVLDKEGKVRWSHIDNRPFMKPKWLLKEIQRVMGE